LQKSRNQARAQVEELIQNIYSVKAMSPLIGTVTTAILYMTPGSMENYDNTGVLQNLLV